MPLYELNLVLRPMPKQEIFTVLKKAASLVWNSNGVIRKIEYFGHKKLPYSIPVRGTEGERYFEGSHFVYSVSMNNQKMKEMRPEFRLDLDIIHTKFNLVVEPKIPKNYECTLEEELLTPAYRKSVQPLLDEKNVRADVRR